MSGHEHLGHRIQKVTFPGGRYIDQDCTITCSCCVCPTKRRLRGCPAHLSAKTPELVEVEWKEHRAVVRAGDARPLAKAPGYTFGGKFVTSIGTSSLSAADRGRMGAAANRAKRKAASAC